MNAGSHEEEVLLPKVSTRSDRESGSDASDGNVLVEENFHPVGDAEAQDDTSAEAEAAAREVAEHDALAQAFDDVRSQSSQSELVEPIRWAEIGIIPDHMTADEFEMFVYEYLEEWRAEHADDEVAPAPVYRSATHAVGVPHFFDKHEPEEEEMAEEEAAEQQEAAEGEVAEQETSSQGQAQPGVEPDERDQESLHPDKEATRPAVEDGGAAPEEDDDPLANLKVPEGFELVELEGEYVLVPTEEPVQHTELPIICDHIETLVGAHSYYLYSSDVMTDAYAHWAFLAAEDDKVITFVDCVREDSRVYPRPLAASNLKNPPFNFDNKAIEQAWDTVRESDQYPDIRQTVASNGDVYYYSTHYLNPVHAASLAEWDAVERKLYL